MRAAIRWAVRNAPAMNTLMIATLLVGAFSAWSLRREVFPEFDLEIILVTVPYPGASPTEVEEGICQKIEEAVRSIEGIKKQTSVAQEGAGHVVLELRADVRDVQKVLNEVRSEVDRIPSFPLLAEDPEVKQITLRAPAINVGVLGPEIDSPEAALALRDVAETIREDLLLLPAVSQANIVGSPPYQIDIEIAEETLRRFGLSLHDVARIVRRENVEMPGGEIKTDSQTILLRGKNKRLTGGEIARIPLVTTPGGAVLTVGDLGQVRDEFEDLDTISRINGRPGLLISVDRTTKEDLLAMAAAVRAYTRSEVAAGRLPPGYELMYWNDQSVDVQDRLDMLTQNGLTGLVLVFLVLALFLELRLAFWVALGVPISILGACAVLWFGGQTLNMLTMFAFLMAMGILVDDAIVIGENIYSHRQLGKSYYQAALDGAAEVAPSVFASISTTIIAFAPLFFVAGVMGKFIAVMPLAMIAMLVISLFESSFVLPVHLSHHDSLVFRLLGVLFYPLRKAVDGVAWINRRTDWGLQWFSRRLYAPLLDWSIHHPYTVTASALAILLVSLGLVQGGFVPFVSFPRLDTLQVYAQVVYPEGTPAAVSNESAKRLEQAINQISADYASQNGPLVRIVHRAVGDITSAGALGPDTRISGGHVAKVSVELVDPSQRQVTSNEVLALWRQAAGQFPGAEQVLFDSQAMGPGGKAIEFKLLARPEYMAELEEAVERVKARLESVSGVYDVTDDSRPGKWEYQVRVKDSALALGVSLGDVAETIRAAYYGEEVQRLQRGRHEVKLMVRFPRDDRRSLAQFDELRVRSADGVERPITELAEVQVETGYAEINRINQLRSITISANIDEQQANAREVVADLQANFMPQLRSEFPMIRERWEGQAEQTAESMQSLFVGMGVAMMAMFVLLTLQFRSYFQPLLILTIIPFGVVGAVWGHLLLGIPLTLFSVFGLVALTGIVVNDSIVLVDFINHRVREGMPLAEALMDAGRRRLRPVILTSLTTIAGLSPIMFETSFQAQVLVPMAASIVFGLMLTTVLVLVLAPTFYALYFRWTGRATAHEEPENPVSAAGPPQQVESSSAEPVAALRL